ncbi:SLAP domain-containing protein [Companilactobacillus huachuanensis]|uniref:SLAP domain-containing protein n=1 Tax=Companilactobacillus huachuanensis TaxID=2559914 RepID=A0ABW1RKI7_9LACO|nr:SLAP domain-containing protein [Companilactobacillus huachuanensis]
MKYVQKGLLVASLLAVGASTSSTLTTTVVQAQDTRINTGLSAIGDATIKITSVHAQLYDQNGQAISRTLNFDTEWKADYQNTLDSGVYYRVATNEFVKAADVQIIINTPGIAENNDQAMGQILLRDHTVTVAADTAQLYDMNGNPMTRALPKDSVWKVGIQNNLPSGTFYSISTNEFVKANDVYLFKNSQPVAQNVNKVTVNTAGPAQVYDQTGQPIAGYALGPATAWITDNFIVIDKVGYYRVANNEYVCITDVTTN